MKTSLLSRVDLFPLPFKPISRSWLSGALLALLACSHREPAPSAPAPVNVATVAARSGTLAPALTLSGIVSPTQIVAISSSLVEPAVSVTVQEGDRVRPGQILAVLDTSDLRANFDADKNLAESYRAKTDETQYTAALQLKEGSDQVIQARTALRAAQGTLRNDSLDLQRDRVLLRSGYIARETVDTMQTQVANDEQAVRNALEALQTQIENARINGTPESGLQASTVTEARAQAASESAVADEIRVQIGRAAIVSPVEGYVVNRNINPGEYPGARQIFTIEETDVVFAILSASSESVFRIRKGAAVRIAVHGAKADVPEGSVVAVLDQITPGSTNFAVKVRVPNASGLLHGGMSVSGTISLPPVRGILIPTTAFLSENDDSIMVVDRGEAKTVRVTEVAGNGRESVVQGLVPGSRVITNGQSGLSDGQAVAMR
jgi:HlyD family secretion protein